MGTTTVIDSSRNLTNIGSYTGSGQLTVGPGSFAVSSDANITVREGNAFAGIDLKSTRASGNIGGLRSYNASNVVTNQILLRVDGKVNISNSGGLMVNDSTVINGSRQLTGITAINCDSMSNVDEFAVFKPADAGARMALAFGGVIGQSPQVRMSDNGGDVAWTIGCNDYDNNFFIDGGAQATAPDLEVNESYTNKKFAFLTNGSFYASGNVTAYSDRRVKDNIQTIDRPLERLAKARGVFYDRIDRPEDGRQAGVIAQEMLEALPEVVQGSEEGGYTVSYGNIAGLLIEALKAQQEQINELKALIKEMKNGDH
jgi:hypothetical protein